MNKNVALVVTTISKPNKVLYKLAKGCRDNNVRMIVIGDSKSPSDFNIEGVDYYDIDAQKECGLSYANICPENHYSRKNIGYLLAFLGGADIIIETDDDNMPQDGFWDTRSQNQNSEFVSSSGWFNVYNYFSNETIWPRGLPLSRIQNNNAIINSPVINNCPIQQGMADKNPDVDAIYRLTSKLPIYFLDRPPIALQKGVWCPFNSQNTTWFRDAFKLMYLPSFCSFRMTDIWRSFVSQRIAWEQDWSVLFHKATMLQERNEHDLMHDFSDEISGYLNNDNIAKNLDELKFTKRPLLIEESLRACYEVLIKMDLIEDREIALLNAWIDDISNIYKNKLEQ